MERFGLYNLLKTFLQNDGETAENTDGATEENATSTSPVPEGNIPLESVPQNACAEFLQRHDERSRRLKK